MRTRITHIRERIRYDKSTGSDHIGCIQLVSPTFFSPDQWIPQPIDWKPRIQTPVRVDLSIAEGKRIWDACLVRAAAVHIPAPLDASVEDSTSRYGDPRLVRPRLGQATFRIAVLEAYHRSCAITGEHSLPALEAAHIRCYSNDGPHEVPNGILLRADLHRLLDTGYITVSPELRLEVSSRLKEEYSNGKTYYPLHGATLRAPSAISLQPARQFLEWHNQNVFRP